MDTKQGLFQMKECTHCIRCGSKLVHPVTIRDEAPHAVCGMCPQKKLDGIKKGFGLGDMSKKTKEEGV